MLPVHAVEVSEEVGRATGREPAHLGTAVVGRGPDEQPSSRRRRPRDGAGGIPRRPPPTNLRFPRGSEPELHSVAIAAVHLVGFVEARCGAPEPIRARDDVERLERGQSLDPRQPDPARACFERRVHHVIPALEVERRLLVPDLDAHGHVAVADRSDGDDPLRDAEVSLESGPVPEIGELLTVWVEDVELMVRRVDLGLDGQLRRHGRSMRATV